MTLYIHDPVADDCGVKCSVCGVPIIPTGDGYTHAPGNPNACDTLTAIETPWQEMAPPAWLSQCGTCGALTLPTAMTAHLAWHASLPGGGNPNAV